MSRFDGRRLLVTGAAGDLGRAVVGQLLAEGAHVIAIDSDGDGLTRLADACQTTALGCHAVDVTSSAQLEELAGRLEHGVDGVLAGAGTEGATAPVDQMSEDDFDRCWTVNVRGSFLTLKHLVGRVRDGGSVVLSSSVAGLVGYPNRTGYTTAKHAVVGLARSVALEQAQRGVRVNAICPGPLEGRMMNSLFAAAGPTSRQAYRSRIPLGRLGEVDEAAQLVLFLFSDASRFATGATFAVDGGLSAGRA